MKASVNRLFSNYISTMALIGLIYIYYSLNPYYLNFFSSNHVWPWFSITDQHLSQYIVVAFAILLPPYYATIRDQHDTKSRLVWRAIFHLRRRLPDEKEKVAILATLVKAFFLPLMAAWFFANGAEFFRHAEGFWQRRTFFVHGYWMLFNLIVFIDVAFFTIAYAIEHPRLKNEIKSVEPTMLGWVVALACYPPFNGMTNEMLGWYSSDYPQSESIILRYIAGGLILLLMSIYLWATVALNIKASNLTNRGIVTSGPYAIVRHPAYVTKNLTWWIGSLPILVTQFDRGFTELLYALFCVLAWSFIYYLRAVTEERHLLKDPDYQSYFKEVPGYVPASLQKVFRS